MTTARTRLQNERGAVLIAGLLLSVALLMLLGAAVDIGHAFIVRRDLTAQADAAALAGSQALNLDALHQGQLALDPQQAQTAALQALSPDPQIQATGTRWHWRSHRPSPRTNADDPAPSRRAPDPDRRRAGDRSPTNTMNKSLAPIAVIGAALFTVIGLLSGTHQFALARVAICGAALAALTLTDLRERRIPNRIVLPAIAICALLAGPTMLRHNLAALTIVALLLMLTLVQPAALGMGDVKEALLIALALGAAAASALLLGLALAALAGVALTVRRGRSALATALPLGPFLALGATIALALT